MNSSSSRTRAQCSGAILTKQAEIEQWMTATAENALILQRPLADGKLKIVAKGERKDEAA
jgi:hypothetical protein